MIRVLKKSFFIGVVLLIIFWLMDEGFTYVFKNGYYTKTQWLYKIRNQEYDYLVHGNSRAYTTIDLGKLEKETSLKGINISVDGSSIPDQLLMLKLFINHQNKFKKVFLQIDPFSSNTESIFGFAVPKFFPYLKEKEVWDHYKQFGPKWYCYRYLPFYRYAEYNTIWGIHEVLNDGLLQMQPDFDSYGDYFYPNVDYSGPTKLRRLEWDLNGEYNFLNQIIALCKANGIELILFTAPVADIQIDATYKKNIEGFRKMIKAKGIEYFNFGDFYGNRPEMFYNEIHLSRTGAENFTEQIRLLLNR